MPNKTEEYLALACKTADSFSRQWEHWAEFLITAARLYKYSYPDQLMIYAQRPDATACAEYDVWNNKMNRYVRRGSKGIALLDESGGYPRRTMSLMCLIRYRGETSCTRTCGRSMNP